MVHELTVVMPVYNEQDCIESVVGNWIKLLDGLAIDYLMLILNDGSTDGTLQKLQEFKANSRIHLVDKTNTGHGPTILLGYREAVKNALWVFQCDSDNEISERWFPDLWAQKDDFEAVFGRRIRPDQPFQRKFISWIALQTVRILFGPGVPDVNVPYRLIRSEVLSRIVDNIDDRAFAPNVIIAGALAEPRSRVSNVPVLYQPRSTGRVSLVSGKLYRAAIRSFWETIRESQKMKRVLLSQRMPLGAVFFSFLA